MKRNTSLLILACEIIAIVVLHAFKMNIHQNAETANYILSKVNAATELPQIKHYLLLSIK
jgi:hypothetical protein